PGGAGKKAPDRRRRGSGRSWAATGVLLLATGAAAASEAPFVVIGGNAPGWITANYTHFARAGWHLGGPLASEDEVRAVEGAESGGGVDVEREVGEMVAVHVGLDQVRVRRDELCDHLALDAGQSLQGREREGLVARHRAIGVDRREVDLVAVGEGVDRIAR